MAFSVFDEKAATFSAPFFLPSQGEAIRMFGDLVHDPKTSISRHPGDYKLYSVGSFDQQSGVFTPVVTPGYLCAAVDFIRSPAPAQEVKPNAVLA